VFAAAIIDELERLKRGSWAAGKLFGDRQPSAWRPATAGSPASPIRKIGCPVENFAGQLDPLEGYRQHQLVRDTWQRLLDAPIRSRAREIIMPDNARAAGEAAPLTERVRLALESGELDAIRDLLDPAARWGAPKVLTRLTAGTATRLLRGGPAREPPGHVRRSRR
jgi:hypothetical protein